MESDKEQIRRLLNKYLKGDITHDEIVLLDYYLTKIPAAEQEHIVSEIWEMLSTESYPEPLFSDSENAALLNRIFRTSSVKHKPKTRIKPLYIWNAAIAVCIVVAFGFLWLRNDDVSEGNSSSSIAKHLALQDVSNAEDAKPGKNVAVLTTDGGNKITLKDSFIGVISRADDFQIVRLSSGEIQYQPVGSNTSGKWHMVETPKGGQLNFILPDGTKVWLNAASSIRFRSDMGLGEREVMMQGEVYFEVAKMEGKRFMVKNDLIDIEVLGTKFNVNTYDHGNVQTALIEGNVRLHTTAGSRNMQPNQLTTISRAGKMHTEYKENIQNIISWTSGYFYFEDTDIATVGQQLARWYNIEVEISNEPINREITGTIARDVTLSKVIDMLEYLGVDCSFNEGKLIINAKQM